MNRSYAIIGAVILLCAAAGVAFLYDEKTYPEVRELETVSFSQDQYEAYFLKLAEKRGARYAFDILRRAELPPVVNEHTVAHAVGNILYAQEGVGGMSACTQDFRNACSHAIVIQAFIENGAEASRHIQDACKNAPGGAGAYAICFHGVGHGLMAYLDYDFEAAVSRCVAMTGGEGAGTGRRFLSAREECVGGAVMELISGAHDSAAQEKAIPLYMPLEDPFRPCTDAYVPDALRTSCISSLTQRFFGYAGIAEELPDPAEYPQAIRACAHSDNETERVACYAGFGKEFVFFAVELTGGDVAALSDTALQAIWHWCGYAEGGAGLAACASVAVDTLYWAGQNGGSVPSRFCSAGPENEKEGCFAALIEDIRYFAGGRLNAACAALPQDIRPACIRE